MLEIFDRYPSLRKLPFRPIGTYPTSVEPAPDLAAQAGVGEVWVKRDDLTATRYGGNKVRRLEFLLGDALSRGARGVWTVGGIGSNHVVATTLYAREADLEVYVRHFLQPVTELTRINCTIAASLATRLHLGGRWSLPFSVAYHGLRPVLARGPGQVYYIPGGGSSALGDLGYVNAAFELATQIREKEAPRPDAIVVAAGTGGTMTALVVGLAMAGLPLPVIGVRVVPIVLINRVRVVQLIRRAAHFLRTRGIDVPGRLTRGTFRLDHTQYGSAYGEPTQAAIEAVELAGTTSGLKLETTYTGKTVAALLKSGRRWVGDTGRLLYLHTFNSRPLDDLVPTDIDWSRLPPAYMKALGG